MINPLQAMQASRGANQNRASAIQSQGAVNESQNLQRQQLNTGSIGARMDGRSPQMLAVDPNMYADRKQQRDFTALNQERTRQATAQQNQIQNQQALAREELRYKNNLATGEANANLQRQNVLDAESRAAKIAAQQRIDERAQKEAMFALTDERYKDLRIPAGQVIKQYNAWTTASPTTGKTGAEEFQTKSYHDNIKQQAYALGDTAIIQHWKDVNKSKLGGNTANPLTQPKVGSKAYTDAAMSLLTSSAEFPNIQGKAQKEAEQKAYAFGQSIKTGYVTTLKATSELGFSPDMSGQIGNPLHIPEGPTFDSGLPAPPVNVKPGNGANANLLLNNKDGSPGAIPGYLSDAFNNTSATDLAKVVGTGAVAYNALNAATTYTDSVDKIGENISKDIKDRFPKAKNMKELKIAVFKDAQSKYAPGLKISDDDISKMNVDDMKKKLAANKQGWSTRMAKKGFTAFKDKNGKVRMPEGLKRSLKVGAYGTAFIAGLEWLDSRDYTPAQIEEAKEEVKGFNSTQSAIVQVINDEVLADQEINATLNSLEERPSN